MLGHVAESAVHDLDPRVAGLQGARDFYRLGVFVENNEGGVGAQTFKQAAAMATTPESAVDVNSVGRGSDCGIGAGGPTLAERNVQQRVDCGLQQHGSVREFHKPLRKKIDPECPTCPWPGLRPRGAAVSRHPRRSEEHTSELQSRENLVCRLLLEKTKHTS